MDDSKIEAVPQPHAERYEMDGPDTASQKVEGTTVGHIDPAHEQRVVRKMDRALIPLVSALCEFLASIEVDAPELMTGSRPGRIP